MSETIGDRIQKTRAQLNWTQDKLAEEANVNRVTIAKYESNRAKPGAKVLSRIASALGVKADYLLGISDLTEEEDEAWVIRERMRRDPNYWILFKAAETAKPEHLRAAAAMIKALEGDEE